MDRRDTTRRLREVAEVRELQRSAAESEAARAAAAESEARSGREAGSARLQREQEGWSALVEGRSFDPAMAGAWSSAIGQREDELDELDQALDAAANERERKATRWHAAEAQARAADAEARRSARDAARHREEAALAEAADRASRTRRR
jgi:hypothetical protein